MFGAFGATYVHDIVRTMYTLAPGCVAGASIFMVERRGKRAPLDPRVHVDISSLLEAIPDAALIVNGEMRVMDANSAAAQMAGSTREQLRRATAQQINRLLQAVDGGAGSAASIARRALQGETIRHERRVVHDPKGGQDIELLFSATPVRDEKGRVLGALVIASDVTELHALQRTLGDVERHLAIGQMAAALAHDFNNILASISQATYILKTSQTVAEQERKSFLDIIQNAAEKGGEIIARVREYLRTGSGAAGPVDVRQVMHEAVDLTRPLWVKQKVRVNCELKPVPKVRANMADLRRVFTNLIINALDAMPGGGAIMLACDVCEGKVVATVADMGVGIPPENRKKVFYPYFTTKSKGTGLGLSGAQKILLAQGGDIRFTSEVGKGTTFIVTLPASEPAAQSGLGNKSVSGRGAGGNRSTGYPLQHKKPAA